MTIALLANEVLKQEWLSKGVPDTVQCIWTDSVSALTMLDADLYVDLLFHPDPERMEQLRQMDRQPLLVNAVTQTCAGLGNHFIRINGWPTLLKRPVTEITLPPSVSENSIQPLFEQLGWRYQLTPDIPGMITPRILAMIINEAFYTFGDGVSSKEEIDIAMKLGTNYPMGPFEWSELLGLHRIGELLETLRLTDPRYSPAPALQQALALSH
ncbi:MAG: 3-hydroxyacyl-CoA dehydrogenase family protein [Candidatus Pseudobacter hemicellulosilyticus]|uniref:3-hydroxyacyl-CoA dehydrogenase family protein n=1 Tax=Candidatus Pseudobacter hemicellulosilyticus TaxID=3121375 RepID=A0AAJ5WW34_9BACT|nr:MAG: 3-hydroxyacyl-CoA dehydrogenase family protein [Pseudobacter sp.]